MSGDGRVADDKTLAAAGLRCGGETAALHGSWRGMIGVGELTVTICFVAHLGVLGLLRATPPTAETWGPARR